MCPGCGVVNRVADDLDPQTVAKCGKCKRELCLDAPGFPVEVNQSNFTREVKKSTRPVLLDFWSETCPPCRQLSPVLNALAKELVGQLKVAKLNVDQQPAAASLFEVRGVPALLLFQNGKPVARTMGYQPLDELKRFVEQAL